MREIKFRAWCKNEGYMAYGYPNLEAQHFYEVPGSKFPGLGTHFSVVEVMQFTGLKDKNGKEIYEGDIVRFSRRIGYGWGNDKGDVCAAKWFDSGSYCGYGFRDVVALTNAKSGKLEVIGNIYETPELLTETEPSPEPVSTSVS